MVVCTVGLPQVGAYALHLAAKRGRLEVMEVWSPGLGFSSGGSHGLRPGSLVHGPSGY